MKSGISFHDIDVCPEFIDFGRQCSKCKTALERLI
jgi:hypothetical protein